MPIRTEREGNKLTKVCVEDIYKILNRVIEGADKSFNESMEIIDSVHKDVETENETVEGELIVGTGISQPCLTDAFDEEIGNNIAFMKAKLNANMKKRNILRRLWNAAMITIDAIDEEWEKLDQMIAYDLNGLRNYNSEYLNHLDECGYELEFDDEVQEEVEES